MTCVANLILSLQSLGCNMVDEVAHDEHADEIYENENTDFTHLCRSKILIIKKNDKNYDLRYLNSNQGEIYLLTVKTKMAVFYIIVRHVHLFLSLFSYRMIVRNVASLYNLPLYYINKIMSSSKHSKNHLITYPHSIQSLPTSSSLLLS